MGDPLENNPVVSSPYVSYEDANLGMSIDPTAGGVSTAEPVLDLTNISTAGGSGDSFSRPLRLPDHLSPHDHIRISDGTGGSRTLELIELVREARSNPASRQQLLTLATAAAANPNLLNKCYVSSEENLLPMLAQLGSSDPIARREGALSLRHFILTHPEDRTLQQGLLATVAEVARNDRDNVEARELLVAVARDNSPQNTGLRNWMQHQPAITSVSGTSAALAANPTVSASAGAAAVVPAALALDVNGSSSALAGSSSPVPGATGLVRALAFGPNSSEQIVAMIEQRTTGTPLEGVPTEGIVNFVRLHAGIPAGHFEDLLRLRILADALPLTGFTGNLFGTSTTVAAQLSEDIRRGLSRDDNAPLEAPLVAGGGNAVGNLPAYGAPAIVGAPVDGRAPVLASVATTVIPSFAGNGVASPIAFFVPALLTSLSGMQGISSSPAGLGPTPLATLALGLSGRSSYHVGAPEGLDGDGHQSFGGGSHGNGSGGEDGGERRDERREPSDAYLG